MTEALATYNEELAALAKEAAKAEEGAAEFFKVSAGTLMYNGSPIPNNEMAVVVVDSIHENVYYATQYDPDNPTPPTCFAFGRDDSDMAPHEVCVKAGTAQAPKCAKCPHNEFGTANLGKGKACGNHRRLAMIVAGKWENGVYAPITDREYYETAVPGFHRLAVTSVKAFKAWVTQVSGIYGVPPFGMMVKFKVVKNAKTQHLVQFENIGKVGEDLLPVLLQRHKDMRGQIMFPYTVGEVTEKPAKGRAKPQKY